MDRVPEKSQQAQQAASPERAPQSAYEADAPQIAPRRAAASAPEAKFTDWASI